METIQKKDNTYTVMNRIQKGSLRYAKKENRDIAFNILKENGIIGRKTNSSNQQIHPEYIEDFEGEIETGFGNSMYQTLFKKLYCIELF